MHATQTVRTDWATFLTGETLAARLLGKVLYTYPDQVWLQALVDADVFSESPLGEDQPEVQEGLALLQDWMEGARSGMTADAFEALCVDYTRLLLGPGEVIAPPWESVYYNDERLVFQEQTVQVRQWYRRFGLEIAHLYQEPDDHIGLELAFVAHLAQNAYAALEAQEQDEFRNVLAAQREFLSEHLLTWAPVWCDRVVSEANTDFFKGIALLTKGVLAEITAALQLR